MFNVQFTWQIPFILLVHSSFMTHQRTQRLVKMNKSLAALGLFAAKNSLHAVPFSVTSVASCRKKTDCSDLILGRIQFGIVGDV